MLVKATVGSREAEKKREDRVVLLKDGGREDSIFSDDVDDEGSVHVIMEGHKCTNTENVITVKRNSDFQVLPKTARMEEVFGAPIRGP